MKSFHREIKMGKFRRHQTKKCAEETAEQKLYKVLSSSEDSGRALKHCELGENMEVINMFFIDRWKPQYLLNHKTMCAYEFMNENAHLVCVEDSDIAWESLDNISEEHLYRIKTRNALFPTSIYGFVNGTAKVKWQINPDGRYWMDSDGYGMTPEIEYNLYGYIDTSCKVIVPFQAIKDSERLNEMQVMAESIVAKRGNGK